MQKEYVSHGIRSVLNSDTALQLLCRDVSVQSDFQGDDHCYMFRLHNQQHLLPARFKANRMHRQGKYVLTVEHLGGG